MAKLSAKQRKFVAEYLVDQNATQAAIRSGYASKNADVVGPRLLGNVGVRAAVDAALEKHSRNAGLTLEKHLRNLVRLRDGAEETGQYAAAVSAEVSAGKAAGLYVERHEHSGTLSLEQVILSGLEGKP